MSKASKKRPCPAVNGTISAAECGQNRISKYACPESCPFNPFSAANYDEFTRIEQGVIQKHLAWFLDTAPDRSEAIRQLEKRSRGDFFEAHAFQIFEMFFKKDANGLTRMGRWKTAGFPGMKNDEVVIQHAVSELRVRVLEVHRVLDDLRVEVVDLFEENPRPLLLCDRSLASRAVRFTTLLAWTYTLPHFIRAFGNVVSLPDIPAFEPLLLVKEIARHLGCPDAPEQRTEWFGTHFARFCDALEAVSLARRRQMFETLDAEFGKAVYELQAPFSTCRERLDGQRGVEPDSLSDSEQDEGFAEARVWMVDATAGTRTVTETQGRVLLGQSHWRLETMGRERLAELRRQFESAMGDSVRFAAELRDDLAASIKAKEPTYDPALVPPRLLENPQKLHIGSNRVSRSTAGSPDEILADFHDEQDREWLDEALPGLENKSPRQAAGDSALRPRLLEMLKARVRQFDEFTLEHGPQNRDINWLLAELGANELMFDPPPARAAVRPPEDNELFDDEDLGDDGLLRWPDLPSEPFTAMEAGERLSIAARAFPEFSQALDAMISAGGYLIEDIQDFAGNLLNDSEYSFLNLFLVNLWFAFVPPGHFGPDITYKELSETCGKHIEAIHEASLHAKTPEESGMRLLTDSPQPALLLVLADLVLEDWKSVEKTEPGLRVENRTPVLILLKSVIEVLDRNCRSGLQ